MQLQDLTKPIEPPSRPAIARQLCAIAEYIPDGLNTERGCLEEAGELLGSNSPNVAAALEVLEYGYAHAFRAVHRETRPEVWLVAAAVELLR
jgi:hypothetical protein